MPLERNVAAANDTSLDSAEKLFLKESAIFERLMRTGGSEFFKTQHEDDCPQNLNQIESKYHMNFTKKAKNKSSKPASMSNSREKLMQASQKTDRADNRP